MQKQKPITWFTQSEHSFASYQYYLPYEKVLVRIRLELGRTDENGETKAMYYDNIHVGFGEENIIDTNDLQNDRKEGLFEYYWKDWDNRHKGGKVTLTPRLPNNIKVYHLEALAVKCLHVKADIRLSDKDATEQYLANTIIRAAT